MHNPTIKYTIIILHTVIFNGFKSETRVQRISTYISLKSVLNFSAELNNRTHTSDVIMALVTVKKGTATKLGYLIL
jgi:hypothetical protein